MGELRCFLLFFLLALSIWSQSGAEKGSSISVEYCEGYEPKSPVELRILVRTYLGTFEENVKFSSSQKTVKIRERQLYQKSIMYISIATFSNNADLQCCFSAVVVDLNIFIDRETVFKSDCQRTNPGQEDKSFLVRPCKQYGDELRPVLVCPQGIFSNLKVKGLIKEIPPSSSDVSRPEELPILDISGDMAEASFSMAEGIADTIRKGLKRKIRNINKAAKTSKWLGTIEAWNSFLSIAGPAAGVGVGLTTIFTTFLTPSPFDQLFLFMQEEFNALHRRLDEMEEKLEHLIMHVQTEGALSRMVDTTRNIRFSLREYKDMLEDLAKLNHVCNIETLRQLPTVEKFLKGYEMGRVENHLKDLLQVEEGGLPLTPSLIIPFMKTYCKTQPKKVIAFVRAISSYAKLGVQAQMAYTSMDCLKRRTTTCDYKKEDWWVREVNKLLSKTDGIEMFFEDPAKGFLNFFNASFTRVLKYNDKLKKVSDMFYNVLNDNENWPKNCIVNKDDNAFVAVLIRANYKRIGSKMTDGFSPKLIDQQSKLLRLFYHRIPEKGIGVEHYQRKTPSTEISCKQAHGYEACTIRPFKGYSDRNIKVVHEEMFVEHGNFKTEERWARPILKDPPGGLDTIFYMEVNPDTGYFGVKILPSSVYVAKERIFVTRFGCYEGSFESDLEARPFELLKKEYPNRWGAHEDDDWYLDMKKYVRELKDVCLSSLVCPSSNTNDNDPNLHRYWVLIDRSKGKDISQV